MKTAVVFANMPGGLGVTTLGGVVAPNLAPHAFLLLDAVPAGMYNLTVTLDGRTGTRLFSIVK